MSGLNTHTSRKSLRRGALEEALRPPREMKMKMEMEAETKIPEKASSMKRKRWPIVSSGEMRQRQNTGLNMLICCCEQQPVEYCAIRRKSWTSLRVGAVAKRRMEIPHATYRTQVSFSPVPLDSSQLGDRHTHRVLYYPVLHLWNTTLWTKRKTRVLLQPFNLTTVCHRWCSSQNHQ